MQFGVLHYHIIRIGFLVDGPWTRDVKRYRYSSGNASDRKHSIMHALWCHAVFPSPGRFFAHMHAVAPQHSPNRQCMYHNIKTYACIYIQMRKLFQWYYDTNEYAELYMYIYIWNEIGIFLQQTYWNIVTVWYEFVYFCCDVLSRWSNKTIKAYVFWNNIP